MQRILLCAATILSLTLASPASANIIYYEDCEGAYDTNVWHESNTGSCGGNTNSITVSSEQSRAGQKSLKFSLMPYTAACDGKSNVGLNFYWAHYLRPNLRNNFSRNEEYWLGYSVYIPPAQQQPNEAASSGGGQEWLLDAQFHGQNEPCDELRNPNVAMSYRHGSTWQGYSFGVRGETNSCTQSPYDRNVITTSSDGPSASRPHPEVLNVSRGKWHDIVMHFKFSYNISDKPFFRLWIDGQQAVNDSGINCYNDANGPYFVMGPYGHMNDWTVLFFDEIRLGDSDSFYKEVSPSGPLPTSDARVGGADAADRGPLDLRLPADGRSDGSILKNDLSIDASRAVDAAPAGTPPADGCGCFAGAGASLVAAPGWIAVLLLLLSRLRLFRGVRSKRIWPL